MTKAERTRLLTWRFKILQQATEAPRNVARTCRRFGNSRKTYTSGNGDTTNTVKPACAIGPEHRIGRRDPRPREVVGKILYLRQTYHFGPRRNRRLSKAVS